VANEAYRAVFLRIHPTGKMVLSLTTEPDGHEPEYAQAIAEQFDIAALDVKVVPADTNRFGEGHGFNAAPSPGTKTAVVDATGKILDKARLLAGVAMHAPPDALDWRNGVFMARTDPPQSMTIADIALYAHGSGELPPGVEGGLDAQRVYRD
jgi:carbon-monoxide dehydrogenase large subunit